MAILASLWRRRLYGLEMIRYLEDNSDLVLAEGTVYPILGRLKAKGLVTSVWVETEAGHPRKYYTLTDTGSHRLLRMAEAWMSFSGGVSHLLQPIIEQREKAR